jgi:hypothetical protein
MVANQTLERQNTVTVTMIDAVRVNAHNIPLSTPKVAGYVTGSGVVPWDDETWESWPVSAHVLIDQSPSLSVFRAGHADVADVENFAGTIAAFVQAVIDRIKNHANAGWSTIYGTDSTIWQARNALHNAALNNEWYYGHVDCWLADWNLNERQASYIVDTKMLIHGLSCRAVQWASPTSNPDTIVPGSGPPMTLASAQVDLSVAALDWPRH